MGSCAAAFGPNIFVVGDPVDVVSGANLDGQTDFTLAGPLPLPWTRWYDSRRNWEPGALGWGHTHEYERRLVLDLDGSRCIGPAGAPIAFPPLDRDGDEFAGNGYTLRRINRRRYALAQTGRPDAVFELADGKLVAPLTALVQGEARVEFRYDKDGHLHTVIDSKGRPVRVENDDAGRVRRLSIPAPGGKSRRLAEYEYDAAGNLLRVTDPYNHAYRYQFDRENRPVRRTDRRGYSFLFDYDDLGRCVRARGEDGTDDVKLEYAPEHRATLVTRHDGSRWLHLYNTDGVVTAVVAPDGGTRKFVPDDLGRTTEEIDPLGNATRRLFDEAGGLIGTLDAANTFRTVDDDGSGPPGHRVAANPVEWDYGDLLPATAPPEPFPVDPAVLPHLEAAVKGDSGLGEREEDEFGLRIRETFPDGTSRRWNYDANGNVTKYTDREGAVRSFEFASWNMQVSAGDAAGRVQFRYTPGRQVAAVTDAGGTLSEYRYDPADRLIEVRRHGVVRETYEYDPAGNLTAKRGPGGELLVAEEVGPRNLVAVRRLASGDTHTFTYDEFGQFLLAKSDTFSVGFAYDDSGHRVRDHRNGEGVSHTYSGTIQTGTVFLGAFKIGYRRRPGELTVTDPTGSDTVIRFHGGFGVERAFPNGSTEWTQYGTYGQCLGRVAKLASAQVWARLYRYSPEGDLVAAEDSVRGPIRYRYDGAHRLVGLRRPDGTDEPIDLNAAGNVLRMPGLKDVSLLDGNRLQSANGEAFEYNRRNHVASRSGPRGTTRYHYDSRDLLVRIERDGQPDWTAGYDPLGRRAWKAWGNGRRVEHFWDTDRLAAERDETGRVRVYVYADPFALVPIMFVDYPSADADPKAGERYFVHTDQIGTPILIEDAEGRVAWSAVIDPYGRAAIDPTSSIEFDLRFPGHFFDAETGLHYNRCRYYDPVLGRYLQSDPQGITGGLNLYAYGDGNPLRWVDVLGLTCPKHPKKTDPKCKECVPPSAEDARLRREAAAAQMGDLPRPVGDPPLQFPERAERVPQRGDPDYVPPPPPPPPPPRPDEKPPWNNLPTGGTHPYEPPKQKGDPPVVLGNTDDGSKAAIDKQGNKWQPADSDPGGEAHGGPHFDVQHPDGKHTNVYPDGEVHQGKDNFPKKPGNADDNKPKQDGD